MPCWEVRQTVISLAKADQSLLAKALESIGLRIVNGQNGYMVLMDPAGVSAGLKDGVITFTQTLRTTRGPLTPELARQAYAAEVVKTAAQRFGWKATQSEPNRLSLTKR